MRDRQTDRQADIYIYIYIYIIYIYIYIYIYKGHNSYTGN